MRTVVSGATGLIGRRLLKELNEPVVLSRNPERANKSLGISESYHWSPSSGPPPQDALTGADVVINLAGEPVAEGRWTPTKKKRIYDSRILGVQNLVAGMAEMQTKPKVFISASAIGFYGNQGDTILNEDSLAGDDFLSQVCIDWEKEAFRAEALGIRVVCLRIGIVLSKRGGALAQMLPVFKLGLGGKLGAGSQWMSWIHIQDVVGLIKHCISDENVKGAINVTAPTPVTNADFTRSLSKALKRPSIIPVPHFGLKLAFGEKSYVITASQRVAPQRALDMGYHFIHPQLDAALSSLFKSRDSL